MNEELRANEGAVVRRDRYTIVVDDYAIRATADQERRIREMDSEQRARFLAIMGKGKSCPAQGLEGGTMTAGWQQPPIPRPPARLKCQHIGVIFANMVAHLHAEGHVWVCTCGARFVVVSDGGRNKHLVPTKRKP